MKRRWLPGYAARTAQVIESSGVKLSPWQRDLLQMIEDRDVDDAFTEIVAGVDIP